MKEDYIKRDIEDTVLEAAKYFPVITVMGPRQSGKTTMVRQVFYIQGVVDEDSSKKFVLSGSSNFALVKKVSQSLAGRSGVFELMPLSISEAKRGGYYCR